MAGETASIDDGGDQATWITQGRLVDVPARAPAVRGIIDFDATPTDDQTATFDWRVNAKSASTLVERRGRWLAD